MMPKLLAALLCCLAFDATAQPAAIPAGASFEAKFSPGGGSLPLVVQTIESARQQVLVAAYAFTSKPIAKALVDAHGRGVKVFVVADKADNSKRYTAVTFLANAGIPVRLNGRYSIMHSKFMVIDNRHVQLGSFNYTAAAVDRNQENVLVLRDIAPLAQQYVAEWKRLWDEGEALPASY